MKKAPALRAVLKPARDPLDAKVNAGAPSIFDINMDAVIHLKGGSAANGDNSDPMVYQGTAEASMRRLIAEFGFHRLPLTFGEFHGLLDYCEMLHGVAGFDNIDRKAKYYESATRAWQESGIEVFGRSEPQHVAALRLYCQQDREGLAKLHKKSDTLTALGKAYRQFEED